jgi:peptide/nickel transport system substrate-binding protein
MNDLTPTDTTSPVSPQSPSPLPSTPSQAPQSNIPPQPPPTAETTNKKKPKLLLAVLVVAILIVAGVSVALLLHKSTQSTYSKKDITELTYGTTSADLSQEYPFDAQVTTNTEVDAQLFEGLVAYQHLTKIVPLLATGWYNTDNSTWIFNLQHGIKFHSGRTMTAADVKYSLDYAVAHQNDNGQGNITALASTIKQVDVLNDYQVKITTIGTDPVLLNRLAYLYILDSKSKVTDFNDGTGPYMITPGTKPTTNDINLTAFNGYHGGHVYTRNLHVHIASSGDDLVTGAQNGKFDLAGDFTKDQLAKIPNSYQTIQVQDIGTSVLVLNTLKSGSPLASLQGRQAAAYALNASAILAAGGLRGQPATQVLPISLTGYDPSITGIPYNPSKARSLLASVKNATAPLTFNYPAGDDAIAAEIAKELNAVGFNVKIVSVADLNTLINNGLAGQGDMFYATATSTTLDGADLFNSLLEGNQIYKNPQIDNLLNQAGSTLDPTSRVKILQNVSRIAAADIPVVPILYADRAYTLDKPYVMMSDIPSADVGAYFWQVYQK